MKVKLINKFIEFDEKIISLDDKNIIEAWFCIRYAVYYNYVSALYFKNQKNSFLKFLKKIIFQIIQTIKIFFFLFKKNELLEIDTGRYKIYEKKENSTISHILKKNNISTLTISLSNNSKILDNKINILLIVNIIHFLLKIHFKYKKRLFFNLSKIEKEFNLSFKDKNKVNFLNIYNSIYLQQVAIYLAVRFFIKLFGSKKLVYMETPNLMKLIQYCGKNSIETFDIQHSMISKINILYRFYVSKKYNYLITKKIIIWGNYWKKFYNYNSRCICIGYLENKLRFNYKKKRNKLL